MTPPTANKFLDSFSVLPILKKILSQEVDRKLRLHAEQGLQRYAAAGLVA